MNETTKITRSETTCVERDWRQDAGGRVLTFDMMLKTPQSPKITALGRQSEIVFEGERYIVNQKEVDSDVSPEMVRLVLTGTGIAAEI
jgi:hypothetical protein